MDDRKFAPMNEMKETAQNFKNQVLKPKFFKRGMILINFPTPKQKGTSSSMLSKIIFKIESGR